MKTVENHWIRGRRQVWKESGGKKILSGVWWKGEIELRVISKLMASHSISLDDLSQWLPIESFPEMSGPPAAPICMPTAPAQNYWCHSVQRAYLCLH